MAEVVYNGSPESLRHLLGNLGAIIAGKLPDPGGNAAALLTRMGISLLTEVKRDFLTKARGGTGRDGIKWEPLKPATIARRRGGGKGGVEILRDTGDLFRSFEPGIAGRPSGAAGQIFNVVEPGSVTIGTNEKAWHHGGGGHLPARPFWPPDGRIPEPWMQSLLDAFVTGVADLAVYYGRFGGGLRR